MTTPVDAAAKSVVEAAHGDVDAVVFILLTSGNLSCSQSILTLLRRDFDQGKGLASASSMYDAARIVGEQVRTVADMDQPNFGHAESVRILWRAANLGGHRAYFICPICDVEAASVMLVHQDTLSDFFHKHQTAMGRRRRNPIAGKEWAGKAAFADAR